MGGTLEEMHTTFVVLSVLSHLELYLRERPSVRSVIRSVPYVAGDGAKVSSRVVREDVNLNSVPIAVRFH